MAAYASTKIAEHTLQEINHARTNPKAYAQLISESLESVGLRDIKAAAKEAVEFLESAEPRPALNVISPGLCAAALDHIKDLARHNASGSDGSDGSTPLDRVMKHGEVQGPIAENLTYGAGTLRNHVIQLIIDEGEEGKPNRANIFYPGFSKLGVAEGPHALFGRIMALEFSGAFVEKKGAKRPDAVDTSTRPKNMLSMLESNQAPPELEEEPRPSPLKRLLGWKQAEPTPKCWSSFKRITVSYAFGKKLTFSGMRRYVTVGQLRELVAAQLFLPATYIGLQQHDGHQLLVNSMTLEEVLQGKTSLSMSYVPPGSKHYPYSILWGFSVHSSNRRFFIQLVEHPMFEGTSLFLILLNAVFMCLSDPMNQDTSNLQVLIAYTDVIFSVLFTIELLCKVLASGILLDNHSYLRDGWNWIDAAVVIVAWITYENPAEAVGGTSSSAATALKPLRTVRVLRPLRTVTRVRGMRVVVQSLLKSIPEMASVGSIMGFIFVFFGIFGVQLFSGTLRWRCAPADMKVEACSRDRSLTKAFELGPACFASNFSYQCADEWTAALAEGSATPNCLPLWANRDHLGDWDGVMCDGGLPDDPINCVTGGVCTYFSSTPNNGITSFDSFPNAVVTIFYSLTLEGWVDSMYMLMRADTVLSWMAVIFFMLLVLIGSIFVYNLLLAVVFDNFASTNTESRMELSKEAGGDMDEPDPPKEEEEEEKKGGGLFGGLMGSALKATKGAIDTAAAKAKEAADAAASAGESMGGMVVNSLEQTGSSVGVKSSNFANFVNSSTFDYLVITAIMANTFMMAIDWEPAPFGWSDQEMRGVQFWASVVFCIIFLTELVMKWIGLGIRKYFAVPMNRFDFTIVVVSLVELTIQIIYHGADQSDAVSILSVLRTLKGLRTLRLLRLMNLVAGMRKVVATMSKSAEHILYLFMILVLFWIIFALLGMETIALSMAPSSARFCFKSFYNAMIAVFVVISGENWNDLLTETTLYLGPWAVIYYVMLLVVCNWIILNLFIAILLANINDLSIQEQQDKLTAARQLLLKVTKSSKGKAAATKIASRSTALKRGMTSRALGLAGVSTRSSPGGNAETRVAKWSKDGADGRDTPMSNGRDTPMSNGRDTPTPNGNGQAMPNGMQNEQDIEGGKSAGEIAAANWAMDEGLDDVRRPGCCTLLYWVLGIGAHAVKPTTELEKRKGVRGFFLNIVEHWLFNAFIQGCILTSSITLIIDLPGEPEKDPVFKSVLDVLEYVFSALFSVELLLKMIAYGLIGYFKNAANILDFLVVVISWLSISLEGMSQFDFLRALRSVRMLKLAALHEGMRVAIFSLYYSLPAVANVMMVLMLYLVIFGILGMQTNAGRWGFCDTDVLTSGATPYDSGDRTFTIANRTECDSSGGVWINPKWGHFDDIFNSMLVLFETATLEQWPDVFLYMSDASWDQTRQMHVPPEPPPDNQISLFSAIFWALWIFLSGFIIMNLFVGVVVETFQRNKERSEGTIFLSERQQKWVMVMAAVSGQRAVRVQLPPREKWRQPMYRIVAAQEFEVFIMTVIVISVICMATDSYDMSEAHSTALNILNYIFAGIFMCEMLMKQIGLGPMRYFADGWNGFDFFLVCFSVADILLEVFEVDSVLDPVFMRSFRLVRIGRLLRLIRGFKSILRMIHTLTLSLPALVNVMALMILLLIIYAIAGVSLFYKLNPEGAAYLDWETGGYVHFNTFWIALLTLFRCVTGESWNGIMHDLMMSDDHNPRQCAGASPPRKCGSPFSAAIFFVTFTIFATFMLLNLLVGVILQNFSNTLASGSIRCITTEQIDEFAKLWQLFDAHATHSIKRNKLPLLLQQLRVNAWVYNLGDDIPVSLGESIDLMKRFKLPERPNGLINFQETLQAIALSIHHGYHAAKVDEIDELSRVDVKFSRIDPSLMKGAGAASHAEVARARARMRYYLENMRHKSLVRTGLLSTSNLPTSNKAKMDYAARLFQMRWRGLKMRIYLDARVATGEIKPEHEHAYQLLLEFIQRVKKMRLDQKQNKVLLNRVRSFTSKNIKGIKSPEDGTVPEHVLKEDRQMLALVRSASMAARARPPMTTLYAVHLIQARRRATLEQRAFNWLKRNVSQMQAAWRGKAERRRIASFVTAVKLLQAFLRFRWLLKGIKFKMDIWKKKKQEHEAAKKLEKAAPKKQEQTPPKMQEQATPAKKYDGPRLTFVKPPATAAGLPEKLASNGSAEADGTPSPDKSPRVKTRKRRSTPKDHATKKVSDIVGEGMNFKAKSFEL